MTLRKLTLHMTITVDGFIANADGSLWDAFPWPEEMQALTTDFFRGVDTAIYGRATYDTIVPWWHDVAVGKNPPDVPITEKELEFANILEGIEKVVFSRSMSAADAGAVVVEGDPAGHVSRLKQQPGRDIVLHGGAGLVANLARARLIDEYMLFVSPAAIGDGKPLFAGIDAELPLRLLEARSLGSGFALLQYASSSSEM